MSSRTGAYEFEGYRVDVGARVVSRHGGPIALAPKAFDLLVLLVEGRGRVLERDELIRALWPDTVVEEANLTFQVSTLRKALGEPGAQWIDTVPKHGYRFSGPVQEVVADRHASAAPSPVLESSRRRRVWIVAAIVFAAAVVLSAAALAFFRRRDVPVESAPAPRTLVAVPLTSDRGSETFPTLSPDGSQVAFSWQGPAHDNQDIYLKLVGPGDPHRLTTDPAADSGPAWSPDGRQIAFLRRRGGSADGDTAGIYVIPALGGAERLLAEIDLTRFRSPSGLLAWTPDGQWLAAAGRFTPSGPSEVWLLSPATGERRRLSAADSGQIGDFGLSFSPDGRLLAVLRFATRSVGDVYLLPLTAGYRRAGPAVRVTDERMLLGGPAWNARGDRLFYSSGGALGYRTMRVLAIDPAHPDRRLESAPFPTGEHATSLATARDRMVYAREERDTNIWRLPLQGPGAGTPTPTLLIASTFDEHNPDFSADGGRVTFTSTRSGTEEIWIANADGSAPTQMTSVGGPNTSNSRFSPDGRTILFNSRRSGSSDLYLLDVATRSIRRLTDDPADEYEPRWSRDGRSIYYASTRSERPEVWKIAAAGGEPAQVTRQGGAAAYESPDGRWLYYAKDNAWPTSIWRIPVEGGEETKVLDGLSYSFNFAVTARGIYFVSSGARRGASIEFFDFATRRGTVLHRLDRPPWFGFALSPDERSVLFSKVDSAGSDLMLVENVR